MLTKLKWISQNNVLNWLCCLLTLLIFAAPDAWSQSRYDELTYPDLNEFEVPEVETFTLDNGIKVYLLENQELPIINVQAIIRTGGVLVPKEKTGLASLTGTVIRSGGSENYPEDELNELVENNAASIETSIGFTSGSAAMEVLKENFDDLAPAMVDLLINPLFPEEKIDLAKTQTKSSISRRNDQQSQIASREFERLIYGKDSIYGQLTEYETLDNITRDDIVDFHAEHFNGNNIMLGIVGDFETDEIRQKLEDTFGTIPSGSETELDFPEVEYEYPSTVNFIHKSDVNQSYILMGHIGGMRDNPNYAKLQVMNEVLSGGFSGRLFKEVRSNMGLAYSVFGSFESNSFYPGTFYTGVMTKSSTTAEAIDAIRNEIERLQEEPVSEEELQDTKDQFLNSLVFRYDSYDKVLNEQMTNDYRDLPEDAFDNYVEEVQAVTIEDIQQVASEYLQPDSLQILVVGNRDEIGDQLEKYGEVNEIDISIPEPPSDDENETSNGDLNQGQELIDNMAEALLDPDVDLQSIRFQGNYVQVGEAIPGGNMDLKSIMTIKFPNQVKQVIETPQGSTIMTYKDGEGLMEMRGEERPLPAEQTQQMKDVLNRNYLSIALNKNRWESKFMGTEEYEDQEYAKLRMRMEDQSLTLLINDRTGYPKLIRHNQFIPSQGGSVLVEETYDDWQIKDGVAVAYQVQSFVNGENSANLIYETHEVNP